MTSAECPGHWQWSAFGATYPDTVCATALVWREGDDPGAVLCDADDEFRPRDVPCPACDPEGYTQYHWGDAGAYAVIWADGTSADPVPPLTFHDGTALTWTAVHPVRGEERVGVKRVSEEGEDDDE